MQVVALLGWLHGSAQIAATLAGNGPVGGGAGPIRASY